MQKRKSQAETVLQHLKKGNKISTMEAFLKFGIVDLQSVIRNIRKTTKVHDRWIKDVNKNGEQSKYKEYFLGVA